MKFSRNNRNLLIILAVALALVGTSVVLQSGTPQEKVTTTPAKTEFKLSIEGLYDQKSVEVVSGTTLLAELQGLNAIDEQLRLGTKEYTGMGTLVTSMHGQTNGVQDKYWQYKVNGVMPQIGADKFVPKEGDRVEWSFGASEQ